MYEYIGLHVKCRYSGQILIELEFSRQNSKNTFTNSMSICRVRADIFPCGRTDGQTDIDI